MNLSLYCEEAVRVEAKYTSFLWLGFNKYLGKFATWGFPAPGPHRDLTLKNQVHQPQGKYSGYEPMPLSSTPLVIFGIDNLKRGCLSF